MSHRYPLILLVLLLESCLRNETSKISNDFSFESSVNFSSNLSIIKESSLSIHKESFFQRPVIILLRIVPIPFTSELFI